MRALRRQARRPRRLTAAGFARRAVFLVAGMLLALRLAGAAPAGAAAHLVAAGELPDGVAARVRLLPTATVRGAAIRLGEIAVIESSDERLLRLLDQLAVGAPALPGASRVVSPGVVTLRLRQARLPEERIQVLAAGEGAVVVTEAQRLPPERIEREIRSWYEARLALPAGAELRLDVDVGELVLPAGEVSIVPSGTPSWGRASVAVEIFVDGRRVRRVHLQVEAAVEQWAYVALRPLARGEAVTPADVERRRMLLPEPAPDVEAAELRTTRHVRAGTVLSERVVEPVPLVARGQRVWIEAGTATLLVTAVGIAEEDGWLGDVIAVRNERSGAVVRGAVAGPGAVRVAGW